MNWELVKTKLVVILSIFTILLITISCKNKNNQLKDVAFWKYTDGFYIGDFIDFNSQANEIKNDTIYKNEIPKAVLTKIKTRIFSGDELLYIKDLTSDKTGIYVSK